jgi:hypothetical protein
LLFLPIVASGCCGSVWAVGSRAVEISTGRVLEPPLISDIADVRQHLLAEQFERFHQLAGIFRARCLEWQIDDAGADLFATLIELCHDLVRPAAEVDRQRPIDIGRSSPLAGNVALVEFQQRDSDLGLQREHSLPRVLSQRLLHSKFKFKKTDNILNWTNAQTDPAGQVPTHWPGKRRKIRGPDRGLRFAHDSLLEQRGFEP